MQVRVIEEIVGRWELGAVNAEDDVRTVQRLLKKASANLKDPAIDPKSESGRIRAPSDESNTIKAMTAFQKRIGRKPSGVFYPDGISIKQLVLITIPVAELAVQIAEEEDGVREDPLGSNKGPKVNQYLASVDLGPGHLWCMAFVYWCYSVACHRKAKANRVLKTASCTALYAWAKKHDKIVKKPRRGDIFLVPGGAEGRTHKHCGLVTKVREGFVDTVEGNTNDNGSSNGIGVFLRTRSKHSIHYVRP